MKKLFLFLLINLLFFLSVSPADAHFPATDGDMTVTLHVDPNDDPPAGAPAHLYFLFTDSTKKFALADCNCTVSIYQQKNSPYSQPLSANTKNKQNIWGASIPYTFPDRNVYHIVLSGKPKKTNAFAPFTVSWYFRVDTVNPGLVQGRRPSDIEVLLSAIGVVLIGGIIFGIFIKKEFSGQ